MPMRLCMSQYAPKRSLDEGDGSKDWVSVESTGPYIHHFNLASLHSYPLDAGSCKLVHAATSDQLGHDSLTSQGAVCLQQKSRRSHQPAQSCPCSEVTVIPLVMTEGLLPCFLLPLAFNSFPL